MSDLLKKKCIPCEAGSMDPFTDIEARNYMHDVPGWTLEFDKNPPNDFVRARITKEYKFKDFIGSVNFINNVADVAEMEGHHPDIEIHYNKVLLTLSTHAIDGLSENDFILAAKIDAHNRF